MLTEKLKYMQFEQICNYSRQYNLIGVISWPSSFQETVLHIY